MSHLFRQMIIACNDIGWIDEEGMRVEERSSVGFDIVLRVKKDSRVLFLNVMMEIKQGKSVTVLLVSFHALLFGWFLFFNINV